MAEKPGYTHNHGTLTAKATGKVLLSKVTGKK